MTASVAADIVGPHCWFIALFRLWLNDRTGSAGNSDLLMVWLMAGWRFRDHSKFCLVEMNDGRTMMVLRTNFRLIQVNCIVQNLTGEGCKVLMVVLSCLT